MNRRFVLFYTGAPRQSGINNWEVFKQHINGDKHVIRNFAQISQIAQEMHRRSNQRHGMTSSVFCAKSGSCVAPTPRV